MSVLNIFTLSNEKRQLRDYNFFTKNRDALVQEHEGKYIVIKDKEVVGYYNSVTDAVNTAIREKDLALGTFIVQECSKKPSVNTVRTARRIIKK